MHIYIFGYVNMYDISYVILITLFFLNRDSVDRDWSIINKSIRDKSKII